MVNGYNHDGKNYYLKCCDCGLTHRLDFILTKDSLGRATIKFRAFRLRKRKKVTRTEYALGLKIQRKFFKK